MAIAFFLRAVANAAARQARPLARAAPAALISAQFADCRLRRRLLPPTGAAVGRL
jgi:hypothetical protein